MTDLQQMIVMLSKSDTEFRKEQFAGDWKLTLSNREEDYIYFLFEKDGSFKYTRKL